MSSGGIEVMKKVIGFLFCFVMLFDLCSAFASADNSEQGLNLTDHPIMTIIDDDTLSLTHIRKFHAACTAEGIVGTFATEAKPLDDDPRIVDELKQYESEGFQVALLHSDAYLQI